LTHERFKADAQGLIVAIQHAFEERSDLRRSQEEAAQGKERARVAALASLSQEEITKVEELANWDLLKTNESPSVEDYRKHLARFPGGVTERFAQARLEDLMWGEIGGDRTLHQLNSFLIEFPQGTHAKEAVDRIAALERKQAAAREAAQRRREDAAWRAAKNAHDKAAALVAFLDEWPQSRHANAARLEVKNLKWSAWREIIAEASPIGLFVIPFLLLWIVYCSGLSPCLTAVRPRPPNRPLPKGPRPNHPLRQVLHPDHLLF
jgi:hypothetical protein